MTEIKPKTALLAVWRILAALLMLVPAFVIAVLFPAGSTGWYLGAGIWFAVFLLLYLVYLPLLFARTAYVAADDRIVRRGGVFFYNIRSFPAAGIQYVYLVRSPLDRLFRLTSVVLVVAGGRMLLAGLDRKEARALAERYGERP